jgi:predicted SnoaL-like aldol condensation-catalyzing enzyme
MNQKDMAASFLKIAALGNPKEAYDKFVSANFIHHNQYFKGDRQSLLQAMEENSKASPNKSFTVHQAVEEGDRVFTYSHVVKETMEIAVVHMFRFNQDKIVELWDVGQPITKDSPNENGLF